MLFVYWCYNTDQIYSIISHWQWAGAFRFVDSYQSDGERMGDHQLEYVNKDMCRLQFI